jgi:hypothetical protein
LEKLLALNLERCKAKLKFAENAPTTMLAIEVFCYAFKHHWD